MIKVRLNLRVTSRYITVYINASWYYNYTARSLDASHCLGAMPYWIDNLCSQLHGDGIFIEKPDQVIINEYMPDQGIASHIGCVPCFEGIICSLT